jgi:hypothetical protein
MNFTNVGDDMMTMLFFILFALSLTALIIGIIRPKWTLWLPPGKRTRKYSVIIHLIMLIVFGIGFTVTAPQLTPAQKEEMALEKQAKTQ